jgi:hypothetical protein
VAAYRLSLDRDVPVIAEVRVHPREPGYLPGEWSASILGSRARVPAGGVRGRLLRQLSVGVHHRFAVEVSRKLAAALPARAATAAAPATAAEAGRRPRRARRSETWYARLAKTYADAFQAGSRAPARVAAERHRLSRIQARVALHHARQLGLLTKVAQSGECGGALTPRARRLLRRRPGREGVAGYTLDRRTKGPGGILRGSPGPFISRSLTVKEVWWRRWELNPRPKTVSPRPLHP